MKHPVVVMMPMYAREAPKNYSFFLCNEASVRSNLQSRRARAPKNNLFARKKNREFEFSKIRSSKRKKRSLELSHLSLEKMRETVIKTCSKALNVPSKIYSSTAQTAQKKLFFS